MVNVIILAGQRKGVIDSLCLNADVSHKALVPINGIPMIDFVIKTLLKSNLNICLNGRVTFLHFGQILQRQCRK